MGFFDELRKEISQAVTELVADEELLQEEDVVDSNVSMSESVEDEQEYFDEDDYIETDEDMHQDRQDFGVVIDDYASDEYVNTLNIDISDLVKSYSNEITENNDFSYSQASQMMTDSNFSNEYYAYNSTEQFTNYESDDDVMVNTLDSFDFGSNVDEYAANISDEINEPVANELLDEITGIVEVAELEVQNETNIEAFDELTLEELVEKVENEEVSTEEVEAEEVIEAEAEPVVENTIEEQVEVLFEETIEEQMVAVVEEPVEKQVSEIVEEPEVQEVPSEPEIVQEETIVEPEIVAQIEPEPVVKKIEETVIVTPEPKVESVVIEEKEMIEMNEVNAPEVMPEKEVVIETSIENEIPADETALITKGLTVKGDLAAEGGINILGTVEGNIQCKGKMVVSGYIYGNSETAELFANGAHINGNITSKGAVKIGQGSVIIGNIVGESAVIAGAIKGDIDIHGPVIVDSSAIVMGDIKSKSVQINIGAAIEGRCSQCYADVSPTSFFKEN